MARAEEKRTEKHLMDLLRVEGLSGREGNVAEAIRQKLIAAGCKPSWIRHDRVNKQIPDGDWGGWEIGNLIVKIPGTVRGPRRLFMGHMDTVPLCRGAVPVKKGNRIVSKGNTALGGDNRTACAAIVSMVESLLSSETPRPPITLLLTVGEEVGLWGARFVDPGDLGNPAMGFNVDGGKASRIIVGAIGADRWEVDVRGLSTHAGLHPEGGISAALIASRAIADVSRRGYFGRVKKRGKIGTSNVGVIRGGEATNQVADHVFVRGESRSHDPEFFAEITEAYRTSFEKAAASVTNDRGLAGTTEFRSETDYRPFHMDEEAEPVQIAMACARAMRMRPKIVIANGGLDANYLNEKGIPTVTLGAGQNHPHTVHEFVDLSEYQKACRLLVACATA